MKSWVFIQISQAVQSKDLVSGLNLNANFSILSHKPNVWHFWNSPTDEKHPNDTNSEMKTCCWYWSYPSYVLLAYCSAFQWECKLYIQNIAHIHSKFGRLRHTISHPPTSFILRSPNSIFAYFQLVATKAVFRVDSNAQNKIPWSVMK